MAGASRKKNQKKKQLAAAAAAAAQNAQNSIRMVRGKELNLKLSHNGEQGISYVLKYKLGEPLTDKDIQISDGGHICTLDLEHNGNLENEANFLKETISKVEGCNFVLNSPLISLVDKMKISANKADKTPQTVPNGNANSDENGNANFDGNDNEDNNNGRSRSEKCIVFRMLILAFKKKTHYRLKELISITGQPIKYLKSILLDLCYFITDGPNKNTWTLRDEFEQFKECIGGAAPGSAQKLPDPVPLHKCASRLYQWECAQQQGKGPTLPKHIESMLFNRNLQNLTNTPFKVTMTLVSHTIIDKLSVHECSCSHAKKDANNNNTGEKVVPQVKKCTKAHILYDHIAGAKNEKAKAECLNHVDGEKGFNESNIVEIKKTKNHYDRKSMERATEAALQEQMHKGTPEVKSEEVAEAKTKNLKYIEWKTRLRIERRKRIEQSNLN